MTASIPISKEVTVIPGVVGTGGNPLSLNAVFLTQSLMAPVGQVLSYSNSTDVGSYFGTTSVEYKAAVCYFQGFDNSTKKPGTLYFYPYAASARAAWLRSGSLLGKAISYFQALSGSLTVTVNGTTFTAAALNLSSATSIGGAESTSVVKLMMTALGFNGTNLHTVTWDATLGNLIITSGTTGDASTITYASGTLAAPLMLDAGILSQGSAVDTPSALMTEVVDLSSDWATFTTMWEVTDGDAVLFAQWTQTQNDRYAYIIWDSSATNLTANSTSTIGYTIKTGAFDGTLVVYASLGGQYLAAAVAGYAASLDWNAFNGRATLKFRQQAGLSTYVTSVTKVSDANAILSNNATYFGTYSAPGLGNSYNIIADGAMGGSRFKWFDTYLGQIFLNSQLALSIFEGLLQVNLAPYNVVGYNLIRAWCADPIAQGLNCGIIRAGVSLSNSQKAAINYAVGKDISTQLQTQGYYLNIVDATAQVRGNRQSPPISLYYMDGGAIQQVTLNSIVVL